MSDLRRGLRYVTIAGWFTATAVLAACQGPIESSPYVQSQSAGETRSDPASSNPYSYAGVNYTLPSQDYSAVQMAVDVVSLPNRYAPIYWELYFGYANGKALEVRFSTQANGIYTRGAEFYLLAAGGKGQTNCPAKGGGSGIIAGCCPSDYYGGTVSCVTGYPWLPDHKYTLRVSFKAKQGKNNLWTAEFVDESKGRVASIGTWTTPTSWGLLKPVKQSFGSQILLIDLPSCSEEYYSRTVLSNPVATTPGHKNVVARISAPYIGSCQSNTVVKAKPGEPSAEIQMGYAWRPGATPSPSPSPSVGSPLYTPLPWPTGSPKHLSEPVHVGSPQAVIPGGQYALYDAPDEAVSFLRFKSGLYRMWVDADGSASGGGGSAYLFSSRDFDKLAPVPAAMPNALPVYDTWDPGTERFDANYGAPGTVTPASNGHDLLMIYHAENHFFDGYQYGPHGGAYFTSGIARSSDDGQTWVRVGAIITGVFRKPLYPPASGGAANPSVLSVGGYLYAMYQEAGEAYCEALARAPLSSDGMPGSWKKYYKGSFSSDALHHGPFTPINTNGGCGEPNLTYNRYLNAFVLLLPYGPKNGVSLLTSSDLISWSKPRAIIPISRGACVPVQLACYPSMISPSEAASQISDNTGYIYVSRTVNGIRGMYRYPYAIGDAKLP